MRKVCIVGMSIYLLFTISLHILHAQESSSSSSNDDLDRRINELQQKVNDARKQKNTLTSQIQEMDAQIYLKTLSIQKTEQKITETQNEIETLSNRISNLDSSLTNLSKLLIQRVIEGYKKRSPTLFDLFIDADNVNSLINNLKYQKTTQNNNQRLLLQVQEAKSNYEEQKSLRETKKKELDQLIITLGNQKNELISQQEAKKRLLEVTRNDENTYQALLEQAQKERASFSSFVKYAGGGVVGANQFGGGKEGWYMTQRDERWAYRLIGMSDQNILEVGCLITNIAMAYTRKGQPTNPGDIASQPDRFFANTALMLVPWRGPSGTSYIYISKDQIDSELSQNNSVIVGVYAGSYGTHYITLVKKDGDDYIMYDPYYGPDLKFSSYYSFSSIFSAATFK